MSPSCWALAERPFEEVLLELGWEKILNWDSLFVDRKQEFFLSVHVDDIKNDWKEAECGLQCGRNG